jgi:hypothetical protein
MTAKKTLSLLLLTAMFCLLASACCFDPYRHHRGGRGGGHDRRLSLNLQSRDVLGRSGFDQTLSVG